MIQQENANSQKAWINISLRKINRWLSSRVWNDTAGPCHQGSIAQTHKAPLHGHSKGQVARAGLEPCALLRNGKEAQPLRWPSCGFLSKLGIDHSTQQSHLSCKPLELKMAASGDTRLESQHEGSRGRWCISEFKASLVNREFQDSQGYAEKPCLQRLIN